MTRALIVVPCRAGSVEVPRKNTQRVGGVPLVARTLTMLAEVGVHTAVEVDVLVSTDDPVVAELAAQHGVPVHQRSDDLCADDVTLSAVVADAARAVGWDEGPVGCAQVTSPFLTAETVALMLDMIAGGEYTTASTVVPENGLRWYTGRLIGDVVSRQDAKTVTHRETGGLRLWANVNAVARFPVGSTTSHLAFDVDEIEGMDIDTPFDLAVARLHAQRRRIVFVVEAHDETGTGHLHRTLGLIDELTHHECTVVFVGEPPEWAWDLVETHGGIAEAFDGWDDHGMAAANIAADVVVFDRLDTSVTEVATIRANGIQAVSLEDQGLGAEFAAFTVNELLAGHPMSGPAWAVIRPEFSGPVHPLPDPDSAVVLVTFGGTDPAGLNDRVFDLLADSFKVSIPGGSMAEAMRRASVVVTSCGRTVNEALAMGRPVVSIAANTRELTHYHDPAVTYLGLHSLVTDEQIVAAVRAAVADPPNPESLAAVVDGRGAERIAHLIEQVAR